MNTMTVSSGEMEAPVARKWLEAVMGDVREREREVTRKMRKKGAVRVLVLSLNIIDGFSVSNRLMKRFVSLKYFTDRKYDGKNDSGGNFIFQILTKKP